jgi:preprotein translocase subunit YajC
MLIAALNTATTVATGTGATTTGGGTSGGGSYIFPIMLLGLAAVWLIFIRPKQRRQRDARSKLTEVAVGDEILTAGGLYGTITRVDDDEVGVQIAPNVEIRLARRAIAAHLTEPEPEDADEPEANAGETAEEAPG